MRQQRYLGSMAKPEDRRLFRAAMERALIDGAIITTHEVPDTDGLGAAFAIQKYLQNSTVGGNRVDIVTGHRVSITERFTCHVDMRLKSWQAIPGEDHRPLIVVDTNTPVLLNGCVCGRKILINIDHHEPDETQRLRAQYEIINPRAISVCEIVASLIPQHELSKEMACALAVGIAGDTERLSTAEDPTRHIFQKLVLKAGIREKEVYELVYPPLEPIVLLQVIMEIGRLDRMIQYRKKTIAVGCSDLETPAILATELRKLDISVIIVLKELETNWYKVSFRVKFRDASTGIEARKIARRTSELCGMAPEMRGGGHIDKGGAIIIGERIKIMEAAVQAAKEAIDQVLDRT